MEIISIKISELKEAEYNPRKLSKKQFSDIEKSLLRFGFVDPVIVNSNPERFNVIIGGHQRVKVWKKMGNKDVPVFYVNLDFEKEKELNIRLNKNTGEWDFDLLKSNFEINDLFDFGFEELDFGNIDIIALSPEETIGDDESPNVQETPITVHGDIYELGDHRLICGDSTDPNIVESVANGKLCDLIFTDPPYGVAYVGKTSDSLTIQNDNLGNEGTRKLVSDILSIAPLKQGGGFYVCSPPGDTETYFRLAIQDSGLMLKQCIVWVKNTFVMGRQDYHWRHESILYGWKEGAAHYFIDDRTLDTVWEFQKPSKNKEHPTMKPVELIVNAIKNSTKNGQYVYEPCAGSGSTLIACQKLSRKCIAIEIDPKYCDVIVRRYFDFCKSNNIKSIVKRNGHIIQDL